MAFRVASRTALLPVLSLPTLGLIWLAFGAAAVEAQDGSTTNLEWQFLEAESAVARAELQVAESHYREAIRESWYLLGLLDAAAGDLPAASAALEQARNAAATGLEPARTALACVQLRLGEVEQPLRELRFVAYENSGSVAAARRFVQALAATGQTEELAAELGKLEQLDAQVAEALRQQQLVVTPQPPAIELGQLARATEAERAHLRQRLEASLSRAQANLAVVQAWSTGQELPGSPATTTETPAAETAAFGEVTLTSKDHPPIVGPFRMTPVPWMKKFPSSLIGPIIQLDEGDAAGAIEVLRTQLGGGDDGVAARTLLGIALAVEGRMPEAEQELTRAAADGDTNAAQNLARLLWLSDRREPAADYLRQAARLEPLDRDLALALASVELADDQPLQASKQLSSVARRFDSAAAALKLAELALRDGRHKQALADIERALRLAPSSERILRFHAELALEIEITNTAARSAEPLVRMYPGVSHYHYLMGEAWRQRGKIGEASEAFLKAVEIDQGFTKAFLPLALTLNHESRFAEAQGFLQRWLAQHPDDLDALAALAEAEQRLGSPVAAEARARAVLEQAPLHARANLVLGMLHSERQEFATARPLLQAAVTSDPSLAKAHYQLSFACARLRDRDCASRHLELYKKALAGPEADVLVLETKPPAPSAPQMMLKKEESPP